MSSCVAEPGFCSFCGTILPPLGSVGGVSCYNCKADFGPEAFGNMESRYVLHFNSPDVYLMGSMSTNEDKEDSEGPVVERTCPKCGNNKMSYATLQLRSADEGQTVFYTCTKCRFKESENS